MLNVQMSKCSNVHGSFMEQRQGQSVNTMGKQNCRPKFDILIQIVQLKYDPM